VPVALPADRRDRTAEVALGNRLAFADNPTTVSGFNERNGRLQADQRANVYNYMATPNASAASAKHGSARLPKAASLLLSGLSSRDVSWTGSPEPAQIAGLLPEPVERLRDQVMQADWPHGTALEFSAGHVFVVHTATLTQRVRRLLEQTMEWRNRPLALRVRFPAADGPARTTPLGVALDAGQAQRLAAGPLRGQAWVAGRSEVPGRLFVAQMHSLMAGAWPPDTASPALEVFWRGHRLNVQPRRTRAEKVWAELDWQLYLLEDLGVNEVADSLVQNPRDEVLAGKVQLQVPPGRGVLAEVSGAAARGRPALWVSLAGRVRAEAAPAAPSPVKPEPEPPATP